ncbi:hypothetical protein DL771_006676 [Monosporascus sp. 5C6A]|nr:hypothetical protein DL771_006676 [Monosporascus sp. 5C6A]
MASTSGNIDDDDDARQQQPPSSTEPEPEQPEQPEQPELRGLAYIEHAVVQLEADAEEINDTVVAEIMAAQRVMTARLLLATRAAEELVLRPGDPEDAAEGSAAAGGGGAGSSARLHPEDDLAKRAIGAMLVALRDRRMREVYVNLTCVLNGQVSIRNNIERLRHMVEAATTPAEASR